MRFTSIGLAGRSIRFMGTGRKRVKESVCYPPLMAGMMEMVALAGRGVARPPV